jgi:tetratricopeptide (TPR) repeat protein
MDARRPCPDSALLAAFLDGMLTGYERSAVVTHLAECPVCRKVALTVIEFQEEAAHDAEWHPAAAPAGEPGVVETREKRWSSEKTRAPAVAIGFAVLLTVVAVPLLYFLDRPPHRPPVETLASAAAGQRPIFARVSGGFAFAPPPREPAMSLPERSPLSLAANRVRRDYAEDFAAPSRRAFGVASLLSGDANAAVASLSIAALAAPNDAQVANDLAAAYYERAGRLGFAEDLAPALDAAERAVRMQPDLLEAWFNRALIITALGLRIDARSAWQEYLRRDASSSWANEARNREQQLAAAAPAEAWLGLEKTFERDNSIETARAMVAEHPSKARELFEKLLSEWTDAARAGVDQPRVRARMSALGDAFWHVQRERFYKDVATSVDGAATEPRRQALAEAHLLLGQARAVMASEPAPALKTFARAGALLRALDSPLAMRAQMEALTATYYARRYHEAAAKLPELGTAARARDYRVIATRVSWILGLVEFGRNDLTAVRQAYEAMLEGSQLPGDLDQFVTANVLLANLHDVLGDNHRAWAHRLAAMRLVDQLSMPSARTIVFLSAAGQSLSGGHYGAALHFQSRVLEAGTSIDLLSELQARTQRARTLIQLRDYLAARSELDRARERLSAVTDAVRRTQQEADIFEVESQLLQSSEPAEALRVAERGLEAALRADDPFRVSRLQLRLAESSLAVGDLNRADAATSQGLATLEDLRASADEDANTVSNHERPLYAKAVQVAIRRGDLARAFGYTERARLRSFNDSREPAAAAISLANIQQQLDGDTALAILNQLADQVHIWIITRDDVNVHSADLTASRAAGLVLAQWQELSQGASEPRVGTQLFDALIRPVWPYLRRTGTVVFVADAPYRDVAFAGLFDRVRERYLVEDFRLVSAPSASSFVRSGPNRRDPRRGNERLAVVATNPSASTRDSPPAAVIAELGALYEASQVKTGESATARELLTQIAERDVVHISTPIAGLGDTRGRTALLVADEAGQSYSGALSAEKLAAAKGVRARLVTLDARPEDAAVVHTGGSQEVARALLAAGVATVVGPVGTPLAANLDRTWVEFHRRYAAGAPAAESLQRAQLAALGASKRRPGPWAALTVFGSNQ